MDTHQQREFVQQELALNVPKEPKQTQEQQLSLHMARGDKAVAARLRNLPLFRVALYGSEVVMSVPLLPGRTGWVTGRQKEGRK